MFILVCLDWDLRVIGSIAACDDLLLPPLRDSIDLSSRTAGGRPLDGAPRGECRRAVLVRETWKFPASRLQRAGECAGCKFRSWDCDEWVDGRRYTRRQAEGHPPSVVSRSLFSTDRTKFLPSFCHANSAPTTTLDARPKVRVVRLLLDGKQAVLPITRFSFCCWLVHSVDGIELSKPRRNKRKAGYFCFFCLISVHPARVVRGRGGRRACRGQRTAE